MNMLHAGPRPPNRNLFIFLMEHLYSRSTTLFRIILWCFCFPLDLFVNDSTLAPFFSCRIISECKHRELWKMCVPTVVQFWQLECCCRAYSFGCLWRSGCSSGCLRGFGWNSWCLGLLVGCSLGYNYGCNSGFLSFSSKPKFQVWRHLLSLQNPNFEVWDVRSLFATQLPTLTTFVFS